jgi:DNA helicase HerA-like ATPase
MRSLRLAKLEPDLAPNGFIEKINKSKTAVEAAENEPDVASKLDDPSQPFNVQMLVKQIEQECVYPEGFLRGGPKGQKDPDRWGDASGDFSYCLSLVARINGVLTSPAFACVFQADNKPALTTKIDDFVSGSDRLLRIDSSGIAYEFNAREIIANVIGRHLLTAARSGTFQMKPTVVFVDETHSFLGRRIGTEDYAAKLDAFESIAKEGRKYGLNICLASQRPRDITEGVLSQMGTLIVHRLTNDRDREVVERSCGEIDRAASAFLPNLRPGEAVIIGTDFPIPLTIQIHEPDTKPKSYGSDFQKHWFATPGPTKV